jgi:hypothetical protein
MDVRRSKHAYPKTRPGYHREQLGRVPNQPNTSAATRTSDRRPSRQDSKVLLLLLLVVVVKYVQRESPTPPLANARAEQAVIRPWSSGCYRQRQQF